MSKELIGTTEIEISNPIKCKIFKIKNHYGTYSTSMVVGRVEVLSFFYDPYHKKYMIST